MSLRPVASLCLKLLSLWILIPLLDWLSNFAQFFNPAYATALGPNGLRFFAVSSAMSLAVRLSLGVALWLFADSLAASMVQDDTPMSHLPTPIEWQRLAFAVLGVYFCVTTTEGLGHAAIIAWKNAQDTLIRQTSTAGAADVVPLLVKGALGLWLVLGMRGILRGAANFKNIGRDAETS